MQKDDRSLVEILGSFTPPAPDGAFEWAAVVFDLIISKIQNIHAFFCKMRDD